MNYKYNINEGDKNTLEKMRKIEIIKRKTKKEKIRLHFKKKF